MRSLEIPLLYAIIYSLCIVFTWVIFNYWFPGMVTLEVAALGGTVLFLCVLIYIRRQMEWLKWTP